MTLCYNQNFIARALRRGGNDVRVKLNGFVRHSGSSISIALRGFSERRWSQNGVVSFPTDCGINVDDPHVSFVY